MYTPTAFIRPAAVVSKAVPGPADSCCFCAAFALLLRCFCAALQTECEMQAELQAEADREEAAAAVAHSQQLAGQCRGSRGVVARAPPRHDASS